MKCIWIIERNENYSFDLYIENSLKYSNVFVCLIEFRRERVRLLNLFRTVVCDALKLIDANQ